MNHDAFIRREESGIPYYACRALENISGLRHGFSTRHGGGAHAAECSFDLGQAPRDASGSTHDNRHRFLSALHLQNMYLATLHQVHSGSFLIIKEKPDQGNPPQGDALVTRAKNIALAVMVADCLPLLVADPATGVIAAIHAGWRGILARIVEETIAEMLHSFDAEASNLIVAIGPGIRSCCFEVGRDVVEMFEKTYSGESFARPNPDHPGKWLMDLRAALDVQFRGSGIRKKNIHDLEACTCCSTEEFFSHRAEGARSGRMMAVIGMDS